MRINDIAPAELDHAEQSQCVIPMKNDGGGVERERENRTEGASEEARGGLAEGKGKGERMITTGKKLNAQDVCHTIHNA